MIRILYRHRSGSALGELPLEKLSYALTDKQLSLWVDLASPTPEEAKLILEETFRFHPLAIEDAIKDSLVPKVDDFGSYLYLVFHTIGPGDDRMDLHTSEIDCFLGANYLVTMHEEACETIEKLWVPEYHQRRGLARGVSFLLYEILDLQTDAYLPLIQHFEEQIERLGDSIFHRQSPNERAFMDDLLTAKSSALRLHRIFVPQRELLEKLSGNLYAPIPNDARIYFRDVYDHQLRLADLVLSMRELTTSTIETQLALSGNRMNEIMKLLTLISTIFMPLTFIAGIYGMNFHYMPELGQIWGYPLALVMMFGVAFAMVYYFRRKGWL